MLLILRGKEKKGEKTRKKRLAKTKKAKKGFAMAEPCQVYSRSGFLHAQLLVAKVL